MNPSRPLRALSVGVSLGTLLLVAYVLLADAREPETVRLLDMGEAMQELLRERASETEHHSGLPPAAGDELPWVPLKRTALSLEDAERLIATVAHERRSRDPRKVFDSRALFVNKPGWRDVTRFGEHPQGGFPVAYSRAGFRNPYEPADPPPRLRVILCGDSHLEGVLPYEETAAALLEVGLRQRVEAGSVEVLNGASGGYDFYNYVGFLEVCLPLRPDVFVLVVYGGNDFSGMIPVHAYFERELLEVRDEAWLQRTAEFTRARPYATAQSFQQVLHFKNRPAHADFALDGAVRAMRDLDSLARREGIVLVAAYLPPQSDVRPEDMRAEIEEAVEAFDLTEADLQITDRLADRFIAELASVGIHIHDLRPALRAADQRLYWKTDHHLNTHGTYIVARELFPLLLEHLPATR